jgi:hypothetical protein
MREAGAPSTGATHESLARVCPPTGGSHFRTTEAFTLLTSIGVPLENTKRLEPRRVPARSHPPPAPKLLLVVFARQPLEKPVGGTLDIVVVFGTGALFGCDEGAAM